MQVLLGIFMQDRKNVDMRKQLKNMAVDFVFALWYAICVENREILAVFKSDLLKRMRNRRRPVFKTFAKK